jgi:hypothetical protein
MNIATVDASQRKAAKVAGLAYLLAIPPALFAEFHVSGQLIAAGSATETARNILAHERLFRLGIAANLSVFALDVVLIVALYTLLAPVNRHLALLAAAWRLIETAVLVVAVLSDFEVLRILGDADYLQVFDADRLHALARLSIGAHGAGYSVGLLFFGLGSTTFCWLLLRSGYIPKALAALGLFSSLLIAACMFAFIVFPELARTLSVAYYGGPIFLFELAVGLWLVLAPLRPAAKVAP